MLLTVAEPDSAALVEQFDRHMAEGRIFAAAALLDRNVVFDLHLHDDPLLPTGRIVGRRRVLMALCRLRHELEWVHQHGKFRWIDARHVEQRIVYFLRHRPSGLLLQGVGRRRWTVRNDRLVACQELHDGPKFAAFLAYGRSLSGYDG